MSPKRWALSLFFTWHITAAVLGSLSPSATTIAPIGAPRHPTNNPIASTLTPVLDSFAAVVAPAREALLQVTAPVSRTAATYLLVAGVSENWRMFSGQLDVHQYLRVRYYIGPAESDDKSGNRPTWTATELILPAHREDEVRVLDSYAASARDKAMTNALMRFYRNRGNGVLGPDTASVELPDDLAPIGRYFARRFQREALRPDERIVRIEIWYGVAPLTPQGTPVDRAQTDAHLAVLRDYYGGPVQNHFVTSVYPGYHTAEAEADISWFLEYFEP